MLAVTIQEDRLRKQCTALAACDPSYSPWIRTAGAAPARLREAWGSGCQLEGPTNLFAVDGLGATGSSRSRRRGLIIAAQSECT